MDENYFSLNYVLYQIISPDNKIYIGVTNNFNQRKKQHLDNIQNGNTRLYFHLRKFKPEQIKFEIIQNTLSPKQAHCLERVFINKYNSYRLLNEKFGGEGISNIYTELETKHRQHINE